MDWLDSEEFYNLCQRYRHVNQHVYEGEEKTVEAFEALKAYIREKAGDYASWAVSVNCESGER